ncbi:MAG: HEAT repeat domain-containing protein [Candidatus Riflebacteria bacterium]|nr:HEAT repeat domain-containing protein [Candidatus Riflebacteria bacterium]
MADQPGGPMDPAAESTRWIEALADPDAGVAASAARSLGPLALSSPPVREALIRALLDPRPAVRDVAAEGLAKIAPDTVEWFPQLEGLFADRPADATVAGLERPGNRVPVGSPEGREAALARDRQLDRAPSLEDLHSRRLAAASIRGGADRHAARTCLADPDPVVRYWGLSTFVGGRGAWIPGPRLPCCGWPAAPGPAAADESDPFAGLLRGFERAPDRSTDPEQVLADAPASVARRQPAVRVALESVRDPHPAMRHLAVRALRAVDFPTAEIVEALVGLADDPASRVRAEVARALGRLFHPVIHGEARQRDSIAEELRGLGIGADPGTGEHHRSRATALEALDHLLDDPDREVRRAVGTVFVEYPAVRARCEDGLIAMLSSREPFDRLVAVSALSQDDRPSEPVERALTAALDDEHPEIRRRAALGLGGRLELAPESASRLARTLDDPDPQVRLNSLEALARHRVVPASALGEATSLARDPDDASRAVAVLALASLCSTCSEALQLLLGASLDSAWSVRIALASAAGSGALPPAAALEVLLQLLRDREEIVREAAVQAVKTAGPRCPELVAALIELIPDDQRPAPPELLPALETLGSGAAGPLLTCVVADPKGRGCWALDVLRSLQPVPPEALPIALALLEEDGLDALAGSLIERVDPRLGDLPLPWPDEPDLEALRRVSVAEAADDQGIAARLCPLVARWLDGPETWALATCLATTLGRMAAPLHGQLLQLRERRPGSWLVHRALERIDEPGAPPGVQELGDLLDRETRHRRETDEVVQAIGELGPAAGILVRTLRSRLTSPAAGSFSCPHVVVAEALGRIGPAAEEAVPDLVSCALGPDVQLRPWALWALKQIRRPRPADPPTAQRS